MTRRMTGEENERVVEVFTGLWPNIGAKMTAEEWRSWQRVWGYASESKAIATLRGMKDTLAKYPEPAQLANRLRQNKEVKQDGPIQHQTFADQNRIYWQHAMPDLASEIHQMSGEEVDLCYRHWSWLAAVRTYGTLARSTVAAYWQWQKVLDGELIYSSWSEAAEAEYKNRVQNLSEIEEQRMDSPRPNMWRILQDHFRNKAQYVGK